MIVDTVQIILIIYAAVSFVISGTIYFYSISGVRSIVLATLCPIILYSASIFFFFKDEFGFLAIILSFGICYGLLGSSLGILAVARFFKKSLVISHP